MTSDRLPDPNRHIIENDENGGSFFSTGFPASLEVVGHGGGGLQRLGFQTERPPVSFANNNDLERYKNALQNPVSLISPGGGANVWYNDIPPGGGSPMHRNVSLDIIFVLIGEVELTLSNGETRTIKPGDMVIQRSTLHRWHNPSKTHWARMVAIVSECQPYVTEKGEVLGAHFPSS